MARLRADTRAEGAPRGPRRGARPRLYRQSDHHRQGRRRQPHDLDPLPGQAREGRLILHGRAWDGLASTLDEPWRTARLRVASERAVGTGSALDTRDAGPAEHGGLKRWP